MNKEVDIKSIDHSESQDRPLASSGVRPIEQPRQMVIRGVEDIHTYVEKPLVKLAEEFFRKNIKTYTSSANENDIAIGYAHMGLELDSMSEDNQRVATEYIELGCSEEFTFEIVEEDDCNILYINIILTPDTTLSDIESKSLEVAEMFKYQPPKTYTIEELDAHFGMSPFGVTDLQDEIVSYGYYFDDSSGLFYDSEEIFLNSK